MVVNDNIAWEDVQAYNAQNLKHPGWLSIQMDSTTKEESPSTRGQVERDVKSSKSDVDVDASK